MNRTSLQSGEGDEQEKAATSRASLSGNSFDTALNTSIPQKTPRIQNQRDQPIQTAKRDSQNQKVVLAELTNDEASKDVLAEKSLTQILRKSWRIEWEKTTRKSHIKAILIALVPLLLYATSSGVDVNSLATTTRAWADLGLSFAASLLGFLIAGFTIFATLSRPEMFVQMAKIQKIVSPELKMSHLKFNFFTIINVFIYYMFFVGLCFGIRLLAFQNGPLSSLVNILPGHEGIRRILAVLGFTATGTAFWFSIYFLKSFVYNIYHIVMSQVSWDIINTPDDEEQ